MIDYIKYRRKFANLYKQKDHIHSLYVLDIKKAKNEGRSHDDIVSIKDESWHEDKMIDEEISILATDYLIKTASRRFIPIPSREEAGMWEQCYQEHHRYVLTDNGISKLQTYIRTEKKERYEMLLSVLVIVIGIIGATTGLLAVLLK